jgi:hypothetical protein
VFVSLTDLTWRCPVDAPLRQAEIPASERAVAYLPAHSWDAGTNLSAITVEFMFEEVTHSGFSSTDGTATCSWVSSVEPFTSVDGGVFPART